jgi:hypothetical protein
VLSLELESIFPASTDSALTDKGRLVFVYDAKRYRQSESVLNGNISMLYTGENSLKKTPLFEFEVPSYRKRPVGLAANHKQSR